MPENSPAPVRILTDWHEVRDDVKHAKPAQCKGIYLLQGSKSGMTLKIPIHQRVPCQGATPTNSFTNKVREVKATTNFWNVQQPTFIVSKPSKN